MLGVVRLRVIPCKFMAAYSVALNGLLCLYRESYFGVFVCVCRLVRFEACVRAYSCCAYDVTYRHLCMVLSSNGIDKG